jgi:phospholipase C
MRKHGPGIVHKAASHKAAGSDLGAVEHVVFLMHENRSFDHYFGKLGGVDGFNTPSAAFTQAWPGGANSTLLPFHLDTTSGQGECTHDLSHSWGPEHMCWNNGAMDSFVSTHVNIPNEGQNYAPLTMGYYDTTDIPFYYALAKEFTVCDRYFCSVLGPTHPNRMLQMTGTLDPAGAHGGPILTTSSTESVEFTCNWTTAPEILNEHHISWKVYNPAGAKYVPGSGDSMLLCKNPLMYFKNFQNPKSSLYKKAFKYTGINVPPNIFNATGTDHFSADVLHDRLPKVSWVIPPVGFDEHPPAPAVLGEWFTAKVITALMANPKVWAKTVLCIMYDENDGFFDHVAPPTAPPGTPGEYVTKSPLPANASGIAGPIGFGVRVPMLVVSPFSRGGWANHDVLDHTSQLKLIEAIWGPKTGVSFPNISAWRRAHTGDLTGALPMLAAPNDSTSRPPTPSNSTTSPPVSNECSASQLFEVDPGGNADPVYPIPATQTQPTQDAGTLKPTPK